MAKEVQNRREDSQQLTSTTSVTPTEALLLTEEGADFSSGAMPSIFDLCGGCGPSTDAPAAAKAKAKVKAKAKAKAAAGADGENGEPDKPLTPLQKAVLLKNSVFLVQISLRAFVVIDT